MTSAPPPPPRSPKTRRGHVVGAGDLQRSLQRDLSLIGVVTLSVLLAWSGVNTYYGAYSGGLAWLGASQRSIAISNERDLRALLARADALDAALDSAELASGHLSRGERWVCRGQGELRGGLRGARGSARA